MLDTASLDYLAIDDPVLYDWLGSLAASFNELQQQVGVDTAPAPQTAAAQALAAPAAPSSLSFQGSSGTFTVTIGPSRGATAGIRYFLEVSASSQFQSGTTVYPLGSSLVATLNLGPGTFYFRARAKYPSSNYSPYTYAGSAAAPTPSPNGAFQTLAFGSTIAWDASGGSAQVTLTGGGAAIANPTGLAPGATYFLAIVQDAAGGRTIGSWGGNFYFPGGAPPALSAAAGAIDVLLFATDGARMYLLAFAPNLQP